MSMTDLKDALKAAERLRCMISRNAFEVDDKKIRITESFGVLCLVPGRHSRRASPEYLVDEADKLLYQAKKAGKNLVKGGRFK